MKDITGSRVTVILLNGWILPIGEPSLVEGLRSTGLPRLVLNILGRVMLSRGNNIYPSKLRKESVINTDRYS